VHIPKDRGKTRPIGISAFEDKLVQDAVREVLEAVYEQDFLECSYGFRPGRSAHDALRALDRAVYRGEVKWILEADIQSFFGSIDRATLRMILEDRVVDGSLLRLVGKCVRVGILDGSEYSESDVGVTQGSVLSPLLGNVYLHHVLDRWFEDEVQPRLWGKALLVRYCDGMPEQLLDQRVGVPPPQWPVQGSSSETAYAGDRVGQVSRHRPLEVAAE
jgi:retron-type reverse transcriptase